MARDASGNWIPQAPVVGGTVITSSWANNMMISFGADVTESLDRSGRGGMLVPFRIADGTKLEPGYSWTAELSTGFYRALGGFDMRASIGGVDIFRWNANGAQISPDDGVNWEAVVTDGGTAGQVPVNIGTVQGQTLRWDEDTTKEWQATSDLIVDDAGNVGIGIIPFSAAAMDVQVGGTIAINATSTNAGGAFVGVSDLNSTASVFPVRYGAEADAAVIWAGTFERMRVDSAGNVGIGTITPQAKLDVVDGNINVNFRTGGTGGVPSVPEPIITYGVGADAATLSSIRGFNEFSSNLKSGLAFYVGDGVAPAEAMRIDFAGNVGIGVTAPAGKLEVQASGDFTDALVLRSNAGASNQTRLIMLNQNLPSGFVLQSVNNAGQFSLRNGFDDAVFTIEQDGLGIINFVTNGAEAMRINSAGNISMSTSGVVGEDNPKLTINGLGGDPSLTAGGQGQFTMLFGSVEATYGIRNNGSTWFQSKFTTDVGSQYEINPLGGVVLINGVTHPVSDATLKQNVVDMPPALASVNVLRPVTFDWKDEEKEIRGEGMHYGLIAQELGAVIPEAEKTMAGVIQYIDQSQIQAVLVKAIQELTARVEALELG